MVMAAAALAKGALSRAGSGQCLLVGSEEVSVSYPDYFTLVTPEFVSKPIYEALQKFTGN